jgi:hypothetical protein
MNDDGSTKMVKAALGYRGGVFRKKRDCKTHGAAHQSYRKKRVSSKFRQGARLRRDYVAAWHDYCGVSTSCSTTINISSNTGQLSLSRPRYCILCTTSRIELLQASLLIEQCREAHWRSLLAARKRCLIKWRHNLRGIEATVAQVGLCREHATPSSSCNH